MPIPAPSRSATVALLMLAVCAGCAEFPRIDPSGQRVLVPSNVGYTLEPGPFSNSYSTAVTIAPGEVVAPINSEVIVVATSYGPDGQPRSGRRIEWLLSQGGVGEFVTIGDRDETSFGHDVRNLPKKVTNSYAVGESSSVNTMITRGTVRRDDDVALTVGQTWVSVTSPSEGTSYVTAYGADVHAWDRRRATATISWVDARWVPPPPAVVKVGEKHVLTTTVSRQTDATPLVGWHVKYSILNGGSVGGAEGSQVVEATSDGSGRASVEMGQPSPGAGTVPVNVQLFRPSDPANPNSKRALIGSVNTQITFTDTSAPAIGAPAVGAPAIGAPLGGAPAAGTPPAITPAPAPSVTPSSATLDVQITGPQQAINIGETAAFEIIVTNRGSAPASGLKIQNSWDPGLELSDRTGIVASPKTREFKQDLPPGQSTKIAINFTPRQAGQLCHTAEVTGDGGLRASQKSCIMVVAPVGKPSVRAQTTATRPSGTTEIKELAVNELVWFNVQITNTGTAPISRMRLVTIAEPGLKVEQTDADPDRNEALRGRLVYEIANLTPGQTAIRKVECRALQAMQGACLKTTVTPEGGDPIGTDACVKIVSSSNVQITVDKLGEPVRVGGQVKYIVTVTNAGTASESNLLVSTNLPTELRLTQVLPETYRAIPDLVNKSMRFEPIRELRPGENVRWEITFTALTPAQVRFDAGVTSQNQPTAISAGQTTTIFAE